MKRSLLALASIALVAGSAVTAGPAAAAESTTVAPARESITLLTTYAPDGTVDPSVEVQVGGSWTKAKAYNNGAWQRIAGTGYVNATGSSAYPPASWDPLQGNQRYRIGFDLPADAANPAVAGSMLADNVGTATLNTTQIGAQPYAYTTANFRWVDPVAQTGTPLGTTAGSAFVPGRNYLYFDVHNFDLVGGLDFFATVSWDAKVVNRAPVITSVTGPAGPIAVGTPTTITAPFTDPDASDSHTCNIAWGDGQSTSGTIDPATRTCTGSHTYTAADVHTVTVTVTDKGGLSDTETLPSYVVAYDPSAGFVTGGGWIDSPAGAYTANAALTGKANFGFVAKYKKGTTVPDGRTEFQFHAGDLNFHSTAYEWLVVAGARAQYKGTGTINGAGNYTFMLSAIDGHVSGGGGTDKLRLKITSPNGVVYDNQIGSADNAAASNAITNGSIVIHN